MYPFDSYIDENKVFPNLPFISFSNSLYIESHRQISKLSNLLAFLFSCYSNHDLSPFDERWTRLTTDNLHLFNRHLQELAVSDVVTSLRTAASRRIDWGTGEVSLDKAKQTWKTWCSTICFCRRSGSPWFFSCLVLLLEIEKLGATRVKIVVELFEMFCNTYIDEF